MSLPLFTSVKPPANAAELSYLRDCLDSWRLTGFDAVSVNGPAETERLRDLGLPVDFHIMASDGKPRIGAILAAIRGSGARFAGIINSDCRIMGYPGNIAGNLAAGLEGRLVLAWRLDTGDGGATVMRYGYDAFFFDTGVLPHHDAGFSIGETWWDLWFPFACGQAGAHVEVLDLPLLLHKVHPLNWNEAQWFANARKFWKIAGRTGEPTDRDIYKLAAGFPAELRKRRQTVSITSADIEVALRAGTLAMFTPTPWPERLHNALPGILFDLLHWLRPRSRFMRLRYRLRLRTRAKALAARLQMLLP